MTTKTINPQAMTAERYAYIMQTLLWSLWITNKAAILHVIAWLRNYSFTELWHSYLRTVDEPGEEVSTLGSLTVFKVIVLTILFAVALAFSPML